jgi:RNA polymerase sigma-70 factor (ECF subfamily)
MERRVRFELMYERWGPAVKAYVQRRSDPTSADDVVAEVFVVCWRRMDEIPEEPLPWLLGVARRTLSTHRRSEQRRAGLRSRLNELGEPPSPDPFRASDDAVAQALARLTESDRELLLLIAWDELTPAQASVVMGVKPSTLRVRLLRARRRLRAALAEAQGQSPQCLTAPAEVSG